MCCGKNLYWVSFETYRKKLKKESSLIIQLLLTARLDQFSLHQWVDVGTNNLYIGVQTEDHIQHLLPIIPVLSVNSSNEEIISTPSSCWIFTHVYDFNKFDLKLYYQRIYFSISLWSNQIRHLLLSVCVCSYIYPQIALTSFVSFRSLSFILVELEMRFNRF